MSAVAKPPEKSDDLGRGTLGQVDPARSSGAPRAGAPRAAMRSTDASRRAFRALVALLSMRLRKVGAVRFGRFAALAVGVVAAALALGLRSIDGSSAAVEGFVVGAARWSAWLGAGSVALGAANRRASIDRRDGLEILALARGASTRSLAAARAFATSFVATRAVLVPSLLVAFVALASAGTGRVAATRAMLILVVAAFGAIVGVTLGSLATLADRLRPSGGRGLFLALVIAPWAALDLIGRGAFSIPGALGSVLSLGLDAIGLGRLV